VTIADDVDVLIVGAGPTGLMLANQLARRGVSAVIVDRHPGPSVQTKALAVQARTLEIYAKLGIAKAALAAGQRANAANLWANGRHSARVPLGDIGRDLSPFPFVLILGQDENERLLGEHLRTLGTSVRWSTELVALVQYDDHVQCTLKRPDGATQRVRVRWVAGCDGPRSAVRELNGIGFPGAPYEHVFFIADTTASGPMVAEELNVFLLRDGFHLFFPMHGANRWRVVGILPKALRASDEVEFAAVVPSIREHVGPELAFKECHWFSTYRIHHRRAERFRDRRCFLLGDAAHVHSPVGAQGMNTGLQDAYNLAWKLALVAGARANDALLDSYDAERIPVADRLLHTTDQAFSIVVSDRWISGVLRTRVLAKIAAFVMRFTATRRLAFRTVSQIGIHYRNSPLAETGTGFPRHAPQAGDRFPWMHLKFAAAVPADDVFEKFDDNVFHLIVFGQSAPRIGAVGFEDIFKVHEIPGHPENDRQLARAGIPKRSFFLLRPDGHIGLTGIEIDIKRIARYFSERITMRDTAGAWHGAPEGRARLGS
jgi:2-polyprenyl-6-methoxyphenol hydroxylase-like FAD-dependent oxidoreductase